MALQNVDENKYREPGLTYEETMDRLTLKTKADPEIIKSLKSIEENCDIVCFNTNTKVTLDGHEAKTEEIYIKD